MIVLPSSGGALSTLNQASRLAENVIRFYGLAVFIIILDQCTKYLVVTKMDLYEKIPIIPELFFITSHRNSGAAWGILENQFIFFYIVTFIVVAGIIYYMQKY